LNSLVERAQQAAKLATWFLRRISPGNLRNLRKFLVGGRARPGNWVNLTQFSVI
jgi:hypothetical protein